MVEIQDEGRSRQQVVPLGRNPPHKGPAASTIEVLELLWVLDATVAGYLEQAELLESVASGECVKPAELPEVPPGMRKPPKPPAAGSLLI